MIGEKIKELREAKGLLQREVAGILGVDTAYISKMESCEKPVSKSYLAKLALLFEVEENELLTLWLADKVYGLVKDHAHALEAVQVAEMKIRKSENDVMNG
jgi:transcriptional regulator with XRE-family HTH domain